MTKDAFENSRHSATPVRLFLFRGAQDDSYGTVALCDNDRPVVRGGVTYQPWPIKHGDISQTGTLDKSDLEVTLALGTLLDSLFIAYPPSQVINLTIFEGHLDDTLSSANFPAIWVGRTNGTTYKDNELVISCIPVSSALKRPGLRRNYQNGCPHYLYGPQCKASKAAATVTRAAQALLSGRRINLDSALVSPQLYAGGLVEWINPTNGWREIRTIAKVSGPGQTITVRGTTAGLAVGVSLSLSRGCNRLMTGCNTHGNILNYGGQPWIPRENPLSQKNQFY